MLTDEHKLLRAQMEMSDEYTVIHLTDKIMGVSNIATTPQLRSHRRKKFIEGIKKFPFRVGFFAFRRLGNVGNWYAVCKLKKNDTKAIATID